MKIASLLRVSHFRLSQAFNDSPERQAQLHSRAKKPEEEMNRENQDEGANKRIRPIANQDVEDIRQGPAFRARAEDRFVHLRRAEQNSLDGVSVVFCQCRILPRKGPGNS